MDFKNSTGTWRLTVTSYVWPDCWLLNVTIRLGNPYKLQYQAAGTSTTPAPASQTSTASVPGKARRFLRHSTDDAGTKESLAVVVLVLDPRMQHPTPCRESVAGTGIRCREFVGDREFGVGSS
eukprot:1572547-Rhodomonas_salina.1